MSNSIDSTGRWLIVAFIGVAASFLAASVFTHYSLARIDVAAERVGNNVAPSIENLAQVRSQLRQIRLELADQVSAREAGLPVDPTQLDAALAILHTEIGSYLSKPTVPGETELWTELEKALTRFTGAVERAQTESELGAASSARRTLDQRVRPAAEQLDAVAARLVRFEAEQGRLDSMEIRQVRRRSMFVDLALNGLCTGLAVTAALLVRRGLRRTASLSLAHTQLLQSRADELEAFAGRVAHDILSPLHAVQLSMDLAARQPDPGKQQDTLTKGKRNVARVKAIIDGLLEFARAGARAEPGAATDLQEATLEAVAPFRDTAAREGVELYVEPLPDLEVAASRGVVISLVSNLVQNAVKYVQRSPTRRVRVRALERSGRVRLEITDTGPGLQPGSEAMIFEPYVRANDGSQPGLGLGLATVRRLAEGHGGSVGVHSVPGQGCTFWVELPRALAPPPATDQDDSTAAPLH